MIAAPVILFLVLSSGCRDYPCIGGSSETHELEVVEFSYDDARARYTYWLDDGAQRVVFDRDEVPETARSAVLVHVEGTATSPELHGAIGWVADVKREESTVAKLEPMALARARANAAWSGAWTTRWLHANAGLLVNEIDARRAVEAAMATPEPSEAPNEAPERDGEETEEEDVAPGEPSPEKPSTAPDDLREQLEREGISLDGVKRARALRVIAAARPEPRDFGLSIDVRPVWLFVEEGCGACVDATDWLDEHGIGHHVVQVETKSRGDDLRALSERAGVEPAVPSAWSEGELVRGFHPDGYQERFTR